VQVGSATGTARLQQQQYQVDTNVSNTVFASQSCDT
jgi:hypothetical protein